MNPSRIGVRVVVQSSSVALGDALRQRAHNGIERIASKYIGRLNAATIYFSRDGRGYRCTVNIDTGFRRVITGASRGTSCRDVLERALRRAATRLLRVKHFLRSDNFSRIGRPPAFALAPFRNAGIPRRRHRAANAQPELAGPHGLEWTD
jgi:ribosome-associated translation inhibitor RaiA